ncbi:30S ribosomal protein S8e [Candidatus Woesearchaeota archaeon]|nr:30S ribosomal protein S8e [Candidatus Woesearchaeota archaeon]MBI3037418.1 30S ribosomal protein S8e [Candidatus Woesearchaeota archaeon]
MITQGRSLVKPSGGLKKPYRKKRLYERGAQPTTGKLGSSRRSRVDRITGGAVKQRVLQAAVANVYNPATKKYAVAKIKTVSNNPANRYFTRANIITKGAVLDTELGKARVTNRPGQEGQVNAVLVQ